MSHTPGPWETREGGEEVFGPAIYTLDAHETDPLAATDDHRPNAEADARLIAAAPELLRALELCVPLVEDEWDGTSPGSDGNKALVVARAAITKARGSLTPE